MSEANYRIRYKKGDFEVEVQGDKKFVEDKFKELTEGKLIVAKEVVKEERKEVFPASLVEFFKAKGNPSKHTDITMIFSYWLHKKGMSPYNMIDIGNCYTEARISKPANITDVMNGNQRRGYLMPAPDKKDGMKAWVITGSGEEYVEQMK